MLTPVFAQSSTNRSRESAAVVRSVPIKIGPPSSSEGRERTVFSCLRDRRTGVGLCALRMPHTVWRKPRVCRDFLRIFRRKLPAFCSFLPVSCRLLSCERTLPPLMAERGSRSPLRRVLSGPAADRFGECARRGVTNAGRSVGLLRIDHDGASGAADVLLAAVVQGGMLFAERVPVASRRYTKKAGRRKVYVCRREDVQCSAVRNRASRGARLITPSRVCGFSACH